MRALVVTLSLLGLGCHRETIGSTTARDESCRRCLAQGRTWQGIGEGECTANCDLQDTFCYREACPGPCSRSNCGQCLDEHDCRAAACSWKQSAEARWCAGDTTPCQERRSARVQRDGPALVASMTVERTCAGKTSSEVIELARGLLDDAPSCPAGQLLAEAGQGEAPFVVLTPFEHADALGEVKRALTSLSQKPGVAFARAFVVDCAHPTFLLYGSGTAPQAELLRVEGGPLRASAAAAIAPPAPPDCTEPPRLGKEVWFGRHLSTGIFPGPSRLSRWRLGRTGTTATLVIEELSSPKVNGRATDEQPEPGWICMGSTRWEGSASQSGVFRLHTPTREEPLELRCTMRTLPVAPLAARRVRAPTREECSNSKWNTAARTPMKVLVCSHDGETTFLAAAPGVEHVNYDDECVDPFGAVRAIPPDGGVMTAVKLSERPGAAAPETP